MMPPRRLRPGPGFIYLVAVAVGTVLFVSWALSTPRLHAVWKWTREVRAMQGTLFSEEAFQVLRDTLKSYPELADEWVDDELGMTVLDGRDGVWLQGKTGVLVGWEEDPDGPFVIQVTAKGEADRLPCKVGFEFDDSSHWLEFPKPETLELVLDPLAKEVPAVARIRVETPDDGEIPQIHIGPPMDSLEGRP